MQALTLVAHYRGDGKLPQRGLLHRVGLYELYISQAGSVPALVIRVIRESFFYCKASFVRSQRQVWSLVGVCFGRHGYVYPDIEQGNVRGLRRGERDGRCVVAEATTVQIGKLLSLCAGHTSTGDRNRVDSLQVSSPRYLYTISSRAEELRHDSRGSTQRYSCHGDLKPIWPSKACFLGDIEVVLTPLPSSRLRLWTIWASDPDFSLPAAVMMNLLQGIPSRRLVGSPAHVPGLSYRPRAVRPGVLRICALPTQLTPCQMGIEASTPPPTNE